ncbi:hypothetical protein B2H97_16120 [Paraclostridium bifermentans]|uniref:helix-turn-helix domain-containing protein n=1 Tax=Paraclostridium bifermentans TaxID=1490 RepID=UPI000A1770AC|nr:helix-turn-helix transcriptional regulator [Paraclostridium bifermentans]OSB07994.1 hypothetical protein B2H97_16120 [Paraclostridium bifermentans]
MDEELKKLREEMGKRLYEIRTEKSLSQKAFGEKIDLSPDMISLLEKGKRNFRERVLNDIYREYKVSKEWFETGKGNKYVDVLTQFDEFNNADPDVQELVRMYMQLDDISRAYYKKRMLEELNKK